MSDIDFSLQLPVADWDFPCDEVSQDFLVERFCKLRKKAVNVYKQTELLARSAILTYLEYYFEFGNYDVEDLIEVWEWLLFYNFRVADLIKYGEIMVRNGGGAEKTVEIMREFVRVGTDRQSKIVFDNFWYLRNQATNAGLKPFNSEIEIPVPSRVV